MPREGFPLGYEVTGFGSTFTSHNTSGPLPPEAPATFCPVHKNLPEGLTKSFKTEPWLHSTCHRWPSLKRICGAVFEESSIPRPLFCGPVSRVPPGPLVRPGVGSSITRLESSDSRCWVWRVREQVVGFGRFEEKNDPRTYDLGELQGLYTPKTYCNGSSTLQQACAVECFE